MQVYDQYTHSYRERIAELEYIDKIILCFFSNNNMYLFTFFINKKAFYRPILRLVCYNYLS